MLDAIDRGEISRDSTFELPVFGTDALLVFILILGFAAAAALVATVRARRESRAKARLARRRSRGIEGFLQAVRVAEKASGVGVWQYEPASGRRHWSDGLKRIFGVKAAEIFVEGDAETLLCATGVDLVEQVCARAHETSAYEMRFEMVGPEGFARLIAVSACNLFSQDGSVNRVVAMIRDVTEGIEGNERSDTSTLSVADEFTQDCATDTTAVANAWDAAPGAEIRAA